MGARFVKRLIHRYQRRGWQVLETRPGDRLAALTRLWKEGLWCREDTHSTRTQSWA